MPTRTRRRNAPVLVSMVTAGCDVTVCCVLWTRPVGPGCCDEAGVSEAWQNGSTWQISLEIKGRDPSFT